MATARAVLGANPSLGEVKLAHSCLGPSSHFPSSKRGLARMGHHGGTAGLLSLSSASACGRALSQRLLPEPQPQHPTYTLPNSVRHCAPDLANGGVPEQETNRTEITKTKFQILFPSIQLRLRASLSPVRQLVDKVKP